MLSLQTWLGFLLTEKMASKFLFYLITQSNEDYCWHDKFQSTNDSWPATAVYQLRVGTLEPRLGSPKGRPADYRERAKSLSAVSNREWATSLSAVSKEFRGSVGVATASHRRYRRHRRVWLSVSQSSGWLELIGTPSVDILHWSDCAWRFKKFDKITAEVKDETL